VPLWLQTATATPNRQLALEQASLFAGSLAAGSRRAAPDGTADHHQVKSYAIPFSPAEVRGGAQTSRRRQLWAPIV